MGLDNQQRRCVCEDHNVQRLGIVCLSKKVEIPKSARVNKLKGHTIQYIMDMETTILHSIVHIRNKSSNECIDIKQVKLLQTSSKNQKPIWQFHYKDKTLKRNNSLEVTYKCHTCQRENMVALNTLLKKISKGVINCNTCRLGGDNLTMIDRLQRDQEEFDSMDDDFKSAYFRHHLTREEFNHITPYILSFHHSKFLMTEDFEYWPCVAIPHQSRYCPYIYDKRRDVLEKANYINYICANCGDIFESHDLCVQKNRHKVLCKECGFCANTLKIKCAKNIQGESIEYQSKHDLKFIKFCNEHHLHLRNGPRVTYLCPSNKDRTYTIKFLIESLGLLIDIKDMHSLHKKQLSKGVWAAKEHSALQYALEHKLTYKIVFPKNYVEFCRSLLVNKI